MAQQWQAENEIGTQLHCPVEGYQANNNWQCPPSELESRWVAAKVSILTLYHLSTVLQRRMSFIIILHLILSLGINILTGVIVAIFQHLPSTDKERDGSKWYVLKVFFKISGIHVRCFNGDAQDVIKGNLKIAKKDKRKGRGRWVVVHPQKGCYSHYLKCLRSPQCYYNQVFSTSLVNVSRVETKPSPCLHKKQRYWRAPPGCGLSYCFLKLWVSSSSSSNL